jgi:hypothetical protein
MMLQTLGKTSGATQNRAKHGAINRLEWARLARERYERIQGHEPKLRPCDSSAARQAARMGQLLYADKLFLQSDFAFEQIKQLPYLLTAGHITPPPSPRNASTGLMAAFEAWLAYEVVRVSEPGWGAIWEGIYRHQFELAAAAFLARLAPASHPVIHLLAPLAVLPQALQSPSDVVESAFLNKLPVHPARVGEMVEAIQYAIEHLDNKDAQQLPDGWYLAEPQFRCIRMKHSKHPRGIIVATQPPGGGKYLMVARQSEIILCMKSVAIAQKKPALVEVAA